MATAVEEPIDSVGAGEEKDSSGKRFRWTHELIKKTIEFIRIYPVKEWPWNQPHSKKSLTWKDYNEDLNKDRNFQMLLAVRGVPLKDDTLQTQVEELLKLADNYDTVETLMPKLK